MIYRLSLLPWRLGLYWGLDCAHCLILFFLLRDAMIAWHMLSLCSSVCLSATSHNLTKTAKHITMHAAPHSSLETLIILMKLKFQWVAALGGANDVGDEKFVALNK